MKLLAVKQPPSGLTPNPRTSPVLISAALISLGFVALPLVYLIGRALQGDIESIRIVVFRAKTFEVFTTTVSLVVLVAGLATFLGSALAWTLQSINLPRRNLIRALVILPIAIPCYVFTYCWLSLGILPGGFLAAVVVLTLSTTPYVTLAAMAALRRIDSSQVDVAHTLGLNQFQIFLRVTLPQMRNALAAGALLVSLYVLSDFGAVSLLGVDTFTRTIQNTYQGSFDRSSAAVLALMLVALSGIVISLEVSSRKKTQVTRSSVSITKQIEPIDSLKARIIAISLLSTYILAALIAPMSVLLFRFFARPKPIDLLGLSQAAFSTILVAAIGALIALLLALPVALLALQIGRASCRERV